MNDLSHYGHYSILKLVDHSRVTEHCNVGVVVFNQHGDNIGYKADTSKRAIIMGILRDAWVGRLDTYDFDYCLKNMKTLDQLKESLDSLYHSMSTIQFCDPTPVALSKTVIDDVFKTYVIGREWHER